MAAHAPMARVPFAPLDNPRLQHLASAKNRQNGLLAQKPAVNGKSSPFLSKPTLSAVKRPFDPADFEDADSENIDPATLCSPSKKSRSDGLEKPFKPFNVTLTPAKAMPPPPTMPSRLSTPARPNMSSPRAPMTAPAGRSPKRKMAAAHKNRRVSAPFTRIDPPFASRGALSLPFSIDAALSGTFATPPAKAPGATIQQSMPKDWFFDIYEDTPEEEAATLMEHSTLTLDLSSDEESAKRAVGDRGKENTPPEGYDAPAASRPAGEATVGAPARVKKADIVRTKIVAVDAMDDGQRTPLSDLETDPFIPLGLDKDSHVVVDPAPERKAAKSFEPASLFATAVPFTAGSKAPIPASSPLHNFYDAPVVNKDGDVKGDIIVWEDSSPSDSLDSSLLTGSDDGTPTKGAVADENTQPITEDFVS